MPIRLWDCPAPGALGNEEIDIPTLTPYLVDPGQSMRGGVIVCPGGAYMKHAAHEAEPIALWLNSIGVNAFLLRYRLFPRYAHPAPLYDAARAIRLVRSRVADWNLQPDRIGILGFSAGGHLASTAGTHFDSGDSQAEDSVERFSSRPDAMILLYPVISTKKHFHLICRQRLIGENPPQELIDLLSNEERITQQTPPTFLAHSVADEGVLVENSMMFAASLRASRVPFEMHLFAEGPHGMGLGVGNGPARDNRAWAYWPRLCEEWLKTRWK